jgi:hypothetical protein
MGNTADESIGGIDTQAAELGRAVAAVRDAARRVLGEQAIGAIGNVEGSVADVAKAVAARDVAKAVAVVEEMAKVAAIQDVAKAVAVVSEMAKVSAALEAAKAPAAGIAPASGAQDVSSLEALLARVEQAAEAGEDTAALEDVLRDLGVIEEAFGGVAARAKAVTEALRRRKGATS